MTYVSTRSTAGQGAGAPASFIDILMSGLAPDGGLYVPQHWAKLDLNALAGASYTAIAQAVIGPSLDNQISAADLKRLLEDTYTAANFGSDEIVPLRRIGESNDYLLELFHGPTLAFKDVALQFLGRLFDHVLGQTGQTLTIVGATSGDTGSAAIEACRGRKNITVHILHPHGRTSEVQRRQMTTVLDDNIHNIAIEGTFDDCQALVKQAFADSQLRGLNLSAINSINWARIIAQSVYYVAASLKLGGAPAFAVPTGNFGNVYAAYVAKRMGAGIGPLVIGSNRNDILTRFFEGGAMQLAEVIPSLSPSMDIQVSSNFERFLFELLGRNAEKLSAIMAEFRSSGVYSVSPALLEQARGVMSAYRCDDDTTLATIRDVYEQSGLLLDPHTAVGYHAARSARANGKVPADLPLVTLACAHPAKFPDAVEKATGVRPALPERLADLMQRPERVRVMNADFAGLKDYIIQNQ